MYLGLLTTLFPGSFQRKLGGAPLWGGGYIHKLDYQPLLRK